ncbi:hypothetical protein CO074_01610 [bacterium (Candidatus Moisslbacteria) CG_4_9_14_0_8_um_filter_36_20]|nr:MAG: hypothetical protein CO074_01610 [bacterium (Candidatus Moisslbacteria) CG_4_9_14_0_8_um_filter_36_20]
MKKILTLISCLLIFFPLKISALSFDSDFIISDHELTNYEFLNQQEIQSFFEKAGGALHQYKTVDIDGKTRLASEIIFNASQKYKINPAILITIIQKEKTLVTHPNPDIDQYNWATGFGCYDGRGPVKKFRGFSQQIDNAAWRLRFFLDHPWEFRFKAGECYNIGGVQVSPINQATAALYNYTPHVSSNKLFWRIWQNWFSPSGEENLEGSLVRAQGESGVWLIQNNKRRPFYSKNIFLSRYKFSQVKEVSSDILTQYDIGEPMSFPNYSLVKTEKNNLYLLSDNQKRPLSEEMFKRIGFHPEEIIKIEEKDLENYILGETIKSPYPNGALLQDKKTKAVYYVKDNIKYPIIDQSILEINFPYDYIIKAGAEELTNFIDGESIKLKDGTLVKSRENPAVYLISQGKKLPILSPEVFETLGYEWEAINTVPSKVLAIHPLGETIFAENGLTGL